MKISKKALLFISGMFSISALGLMFVSADNRNLSTDPNNAVLRIGEEIKIISTESGNNTTATIRKVNNKSIGITGNNSALNFILGQSGNDENIFNGNGSGSSILGGKKNYIGGSCHVILGGSGNNIAGTYNTILGGEGNKIRCGSYHTIVGGKNNIITTSQCIPGFENDHYSVIVGGYNNTISGDFSVIMGNNSSVTGNYSVALGSGSYISGNNSFLWTDGSSSESLEKDDTFTVIDQNGAAINTDTVHSFAKLTIGGPLIISGSKNQSGISCGGGEGGGTLKIEKSDEEQLCLCSCDGSGWNSLFGKGRCLSVCNQASQQPKCGTEVNRVCNNKGVTYSGSCDQGIPVEGTGAYFIDKNDVIYWSCQTKDGTIANCSGSTIGGKEPSECEVDPIAYLIPGPEINAEMKSLAEDDLKNIKYFNMYTGNTIPSGVTTELISEETSPFEVFMRYDSDSQTMYYHTDAESIYMNPNSSSIFSGCTKLTDFNISNWNTSKATDMSSMFYKCRSLTNLDLNDWNTENVRDMSNMFYYCTKLENLNISNWDTHNVTNMHKMFHDCRLLNHLHLNNWNTENVNSMRSMFQNCGGLSDIEISNWNTQNVTDMHDMFEECNSLENLNISNRNTENVRDMSNMFQYCSNLTELDVSNWNTSKVTNMSYMFDNCIHLTNLNVSNWNTSNVTNMEQLFRNTSDLTGLDLSNWDTSKVQNMSGMFENSYNLRTIYASNKFVTNAVTTSSNMFNGNTQLIGGNGTTYDSSHIDAEYARIDGKDGLPGYFTEKVAYLITGQNIKNKIYNLAGNTSYINYFKRYTGNSIPLNAQIISTEESPSKVFMWLDGDTIYYFTDANRIYLNKNSISMFGGFENLKFIDTSGWDTSKVTNMNSIFSYCPRLTNLDVSNWDTSNVTDMSYMFINCTNLTGLDVSNWDTRNVTSMNSMFQNCSVLTELDISNWNTSILARTKDMFKGCQNLKTIYASDKFVRSAFLQDSTNMFYGDTQLIGGNGTTYSWLNIDFEYARIDGKNGLPGYFTERTATFKPGVDFDTTLQSLATQAGDNYYNIDKLIRINKETVDNMPSGTRSQLLSSSDSLYPISGRYIGGTIYYYAEPQKIYLNENSSYMFNYLNLSSIDTSGWDTSKVKNMTNMFGGLSRVTNLDIENWDTHNVTSMSYMFQSCGLTRLNLSNWDTSSVTDMSFMFDGCKNLTSLDLSNWDTSSGTNMTKMFSSCSGLTSLDISNFDTSKVTSMSQMFEGCTNLTSLDLSNWNTSKLKNTQHMFKNCSNLKTIYASDNFVTNGINSSSEMFKNASQLLGGNGTIYSSSHTNKEYARIDGKNGLPGYFTESSGNSTKTAYLITGQNINNKMKSIAGDLNNIQYFKRYTGNSRPLNVQIISTEESPSKVDMWYDNSSQTIYYHTKAETIYLNHDSSSMFSELRNVQTIDTSGWDTSNVENMSAMFMNCRKLNNFNLSNFNTSNVEDMSFMFYDLFYDGDELGDPNISGWDTSNVKNMSSMFNGSKFKSLNISGWNTSNVKDMSYMFVGCENLTSLDIGKRNTSSVKDMNYMFAGLKGLTSLDLSGWDTSKVTDMHAMFTLSQNLNNLNLSNWDTRNVTGMYEMFSDCKSLTNLDLSNWNTSNVEDMSSMFIRCNNLKTIYASTGFITTSVTHSVSMFDGATSLVGGNGTIYTSSHTNKEYARIDKSGQPGYFTEKSGNSTESIAYLIPGQDINNKMKELTDVSNIKYFKMYTGNSIPSGVTTKTISTDEGKEVKIWYDNSKKTIYYYTDASKIYLNSDSIGIFQGLIYLKNITFDERFDASNVTNMSAMFSDCQSLTSLDFSKGNWNTTNVTDMSSMFYNCTDLETINFGSKWNTTNVTNMSAMFSTQNCEDTYVTQLTELDLSSWNTNNVTNMSQMFKCSKNLKTIYTSENFKTDNVSNSKNMFYKAINLEGGQGTKYSSSHVDKEYAKLDCRTNAPGYFSGKTQYSCNNSTPVSEPKCGDSQNNKCINSTASNINSANTKWTCSNGESSVDCIYSCDKECPLGYVLNGSMCTLYKQFCYIRPGKKSTSCFGDTSNKYQSDTSNTAPIDHGFDVDLRSTDFNYLANGKYYYQGFSRINNETPYMIVYQTDHNLNNCYLPDDYPAFSNLLNECHTTLYAQGSDTDNGYYINSCNTGNINTVEPCKTCSVTEDITLQPISSCEQECIDHNLNYCIDRCCPDPTCLENSPYSTCFMCGSNFGG